jgi:hypothetical protein
VRIQPVKRRALMLTYNAAHQRRADALNTERLYGGCALAAFASYPPALRLPISLCWIGLSYRLVQSAEAANWRAVHIGLKQGPRYFGNLRLRRVMTVKLIAEPKKQFSLHASHQVRELSIRGALCSQRG